MEISKQAMALVNRKIYKDNRVLAIRMEVEMVISKDKAHKDNNKVKVVDKDSKVDSKVKTDNRVSNRAMVLSLVHRVNNKVKGNNLVVVKINNSKVRAKVINKPVVLNLVHKDSNKVRVTVSNRVHKVRLRTVSKDNRVVRNHNNPVVRAIRVNRVDSKVKTDNRVSNNSNSKIKAKVNLNKLK